MKKYPTITREERIKLTSEGWTIKGAGLYEPLHAPRGTKFVHVKITDKLTKFCRMVPPPKTKTLKHAKEVLSKLGMTVSKRDNEFRVNFERGKEATAYYTNDIEDAIATGVSMFGRSTGLGTFFN